MGEPERLEKQAFKQSLASHIFKSAAEQAQDLYWSAGNLYKAQGRPEKAAECYIHGVRLLRSSQGYDYALEAGDLYLKAKNLGEAQRALELAVAIAASANAKPGIALRTLARAYRGENLEKAAECLREAYTAFDAQGQPRMAAKCMLDLAELYAHRATDPEMYIEALGAYDTAVGYMGSVGLRSSVNTTLKQVFCAALGEVPVRQYRLGEMQGYLERIQFTLASNDEQGFTEALYGWDQKYKLDDTAVMLSLGVKRMLEQSELL